MLNYQELIQALAKDYLNVFTVDCITNTASIIKLNGYVTDGILDAPKEFNYDQMLIKYATGRVLKDDLNNFLSFLKNESLINIFTMHNNDEYEFTYRILDDNKKVHFYSAHYIKLSTNKEDLKLVVGFRNIDALVDNQKETHSEGLYEAYEAISSIFLSMHRIDVKNNRFYEIKTTKYIKKIIMANEGLWDGSIQTVMQDLCTAPFRESLLKFLDIHTFEERLKDKDQISYEFIARYSGWCRGRIIKEDVDEDGKLSHVIFTIEVIDVDKQREESLKKAAHTDLLTGIFNRGYGEECITNLLNENNDGLFALFDVDHFKSFNDIYGHDIGDKVIVEIAKALEKASHKSDIVFRLGGDEFAIYSPITKTREEVALLWNNIVVRIKNIHINEINEPITISLGGTFVKKEINDTFSTLYKRADKAMYISKKEEGFKLTLLD